MANMYSDDEYYDDKYSGYGHTGNPAMPMDRMEYTVPEPVKKFLQYFQDMIKEGNVYEINNLYENSFPKLTEQFFKTSPRPEAEDIAGYVADDPHLPEPVQGAVFRHIYARVQGGPTVEQRFEFYYIYCKLFNYILSADTPPQST